MPVLGTCPVCRSSVSLTAKNCPHCGERDFQEFRYSHVMPCLYCKGGTRQNFYDHSAIENCPVCQATGSLTVYQEIDRRNDAELGRWYFNHVHNAYVNLNAEHGTVIACRKG